jgi:hypothetical protein
MPKLPIRHPQDTPYLTVGLLSASSHGRLRAGLTTRSAGGVRRVRNDLRKGRQLEGIAKGQAKAEVTGCSRATIAKIAKRLKKEA